MKLTTCLLIAATLAVVTSCCGCPPEPSTTASEPEPTETSPAGEVEILCLRPNGEPFPNCTLYAVVERDGEALLQEWLRARTNASGRVRVMLSDPGRMSPQHVLPKHLRSPFTVTVLADSYGQAPAAATWEPGQSELTLQFQKPADLTVKLTEMPARLVETAAVEIRYLSPGLTARNCRSRSALGVGTGPLENVRLQADGTIRVRPVAPGPAVIRLLDPLSSPHLQPITSTEIELVSGPQTVTVPVPPLHELDVYVPSMPERSDVRLVPVDRPNRRAGLLPYLARAALDQDRRAHFPLLRPGPYDIRVYGLPGEKRIQVPTDAVTFDE